MHTLCFKKKITQKIFTFPQRKNPSLLKVSVFRTISNILVWNIPIPVWNRSTRISTFGPLRPLTCHRDHTSRLKNLTMLIVSDIHTYGYLSFFCICPATVGALFLKINEWTFIHISNKSIIRLSITYGHPLF